MSIVRHFKFNVFLVAFALLIGATAAHAQTEFSYQGRLVDEGAPADGNFDFEFNLYSNDSGGSQIAPTSISEDVVVRDGYFVTQVDFGAVFDGSEVWIEVNVRPAASSDPFDTLSPRQSITRAPQAMVADTALSADSVDWTNVTNAPTDLATDSDVLDLQAQINALQSQLDAVSSQASPYILGESAGSSNGRFEHSGEFGVHAANKMCVDTYNTASAHLCTLGEVQRALASDSYGNALVASASLTTSETWTIAPVVTGGAFVNSSSQNTCHNLLYNSGDTARGTRLTVELNYTSGGNGGGVTDNHFNVQKDIACATNMPVLCCR